MIIVDKIDIKDKSIENWADFVSNSSERINWHASKFGKVSAIFDWYDVKSFKGNTRVSQNEGIVPVH